MKKYLIKTTALIVIFVTLASCSVILVSADETELRPSCVEHHFNMLGTASNSTPPSVYSCAYVVLSMLLSFYDSYWHENFVPDNFEWDKGTYDSSTDTLVNTFNASTESSAWDAFKNTDESNYKEFVADTDDDDHHLESYLISIAKDINLCEEDDTKFGLRPYEIVTFLEYYLYDIQGFNEDQVTVHIQTQVLSTTGDDALFETMKQHISKGFPVIYGGSSVDLIGYHLESTIINDEGGHALMAYSTVGTGNSVTDINLNTGWNTSAKQTVNTTKYSFLNEIVWLEINEENLPHECTDAYYDTHKETNVCACYVYYNTHPAHQSHNYQFNGLDSNTHFEKCYCGEKTNIEAHSLSYSYYSPTQHYEECEDCLYAGAESHTYNRICESSSSEGHNLACVCGQVSSTKSDHYSSTYERYTTTKHKTYCACGYYMGAMAHVVSTTGSGFKICIYCGERIDTSIIITPVPGTNSASMRYITEAGSYVDANGIIYLVPSDLELVMAGELDVYALVENGGDLVTQ